MEGPKLRNLKETKGSLKRRKYKHFCQTICKTWFENQAWVIVVRSECFYPCSISAPQLYCCYLQHFPNRGHFSSCCETETIIIAKTNQSKDKCHQKPMRIHCKKCMVHCTKLSLALILKSDWLRKR